MFNNTQITPHDTKIEDKHFDEERALYNLKNADVTNCVFAGPADGESSLKETRNVNVVDCKFSLRYPLWHSENFTLINSSMDELTRAPIWYAKDGVISNCTLEGIKLLRDCNNIQIKDTTINSPETGWKCNDITVSNSSIESEYLFLDSTNLNIDHLKMQGKYSFQYADQIHINHSELDTKDAFWHSKNVIVENTVINGEFLGWFSENLTMINCKIIGTQPFCYCKNLKLINCTMENADLAFEHSDVNADIKGHVISIKNPKSGTIIVDSVGEIIRDSTVMEINGEIQIRK